MVTLFKQLPVYIFILVVFMCSCKSSSPGNQGIIDEIDKKQTEKEAMVEAVTGYPIPTSVEVTQMLNKAGASYIMDITNGIDHVDRYTTNNQKAINLGIYGADLSYSVTYKQTQETINYLKVSKKLIDELDISSRFNDSLEERIEENLDNSDSLIQIITDSFYDSYQYLKKNEQDNLSLLVIAGSWIEGMYLTSELAELSVENEELLKLVANQKNSLMVLIDLLGPADDQPYIAGLSERLTSLLQKFPGDPQDISQDEFNEIRREITNIRSDIVNG